MKCTSLSTNLRRFFKHPCKRNLNLRSFLRSSWSSTNSEPGFDRIPGVRCVRFGDPAVSFTPFVWFVTSRSAGPVRALIQSVYICFETEEKSTIYFSNYQGLDECMYGTCGAQYLQKVKNYCYKGYTPIWKNYCTEMERLQLKSSSMGLLKDLADWSSNINASEQHLIKLLEASKLWKSVLYL